MVSCLLSYRRFWKDIQVENPLTSPRDPTPQNPEVRPTQHIPIPWDLILCDEGKLLKIPPPNYYTFSFRKLGASLFKNQGMPVGRQGASGRLFVVRNNRAGIWISVAGRQFGKTHKHQEQKE